MEDMTIQSLMEDANALPEACKKMWNTRVSDLSSEQMAILDMMISTSTVDPTILNALPTQYSPHTVGWSVRYCKAGNEDERISHPDCIMKHATKPNYPVWELTYSGSLIQRYSAIRADGKGIIFVRGGKKLELTPEDIGRLNIAGISSVRVIIESRSGVGIDKGEIKVSDIPIQSNTYSLKYLLVFLFIVLISIVVGIAVALMK